MLKTEEEPIDIVVTWLDNKDPKWLADKRRWQNEISPSKTAAETRRFDSDPDLLKYWFRLIEKNAPFVRKVFFVTYGHIPKWLNTKNKKLAVVKHGDFIPREYSPTFNSAVIEMNLFRIKELSERFVYFNDDVYLSAPAVLEDFFVGDKVKYNYTEALMCFDESLDLEFRNILLNVARVINRNFDKRTAMKKYSRTFFNLVNRASTKNALRYMNFNKYLGPIPAHVSMPFLKSTFEDVWRAEQDELDRTSRLKFRSDTTISPYVLEVWQAFCGKTVPFEQDKFGKLFSTDEVTADMVEAIRKGRYKVICLNGQFSKTDMGVIKEAFLEAVPEKSTFEK